MLARKIHPEIPMRNGILAAGNFIVDRIKRIDAYPAENMLANIEGEARSNGGGPYNVLKDLAAMGVAYPLFAAGRIGGDEDGRWILEDCRAHGIDTACLVPDPNCPTSYTDVMTVAATGRRTFFHRRGANARFDGENINFQNSTARHFHLAYLMLLDEMDRIDASGRTAASRLLEVAITAGLTTSIDVVSTEHPQFRDIVLSSLPFTDHLLINEVEACRVLGRPLDPGNARSLLEAASELLSAGVRTAVVLHTEHGAVTARRDGTQLQQGAVKVPAAGIRGANGAGDAFAAGYLHAIHESFPPAAALQLAVCTAAACLSDPSPSAGLLRTDDCLGLGQVHGYGW
jgi:sugar/nucleoside kinase (ribokinase family)